jgi:translation initiation factor IF-1
MSRVTKLKHVKREIEADDISLPKDNQHIVRIVSSKGNNLHEVESPESSENFLVTMPNKFRQNIWVKRGSFVLIESIPEGKQAIELKYNFYKFMDHITRRKSEGRNCEDLNRRPSKGIF